MRGAEEEPPPDDGRCKVWMTLKAEGRSFSVSHSVVPLPEGDSLVAMDDESRDALKLLGYMDEDDRDEEPGD